MIDVRQIKYFVAVAEELHFGRAAERLGIAQPPLTQQIQKLERELGCRLFARNSRRTSLTEAGRVLLAESRRVTTALEHAIENTRRVARGETGQLRVGTPPSVMLTSLPTAIRKYRQKYPDVSLTLREASTSAILRELRTGALDVGFLREEEATAGLAGERILCESLVAVLPSGHRLVEVKKLSLRQLSAEPFILFPRAVGEVFYDHLMDCCGQAGFVPRIVLEATQWQSVVTFVETGLGVSMAPACVAKFRWKGVVYKELLGLRTSTFAAWQAADTPPAVTQFLKLVRTEI